MLAVKRTKNWCMFGLIFVFSPFCVSAETDAIIHDKAGDFEINEELKTESQKLIVEESDQDTQKTTDKEVEKKSFINPWLGINFEYLKQMLEQNWLIKRRTSKIRKSRLALVVESSKDRHFRRSAELLTRDPGLRQMFSSLSIFPALLKTGAEMSRKIFMLVAQQLQKREIEPKKAVSILEQCLELNSSLLTTSKSVVTALDEHLHEFSQRNHTDRHVSYLLSEFVNQNDELIEMFRKMNLEYELIINQMILLERHRKIEIDFLKRNSLKNRIKLAARLAKISNSFAKNIYHIKNYHYSLEEFIVKLADFLEVTEERLIEIAHLKWENQSENLKNFYIFPDRDKHLATTKKFVYLNHFEIVCVVLDKQNELLKSLEVSTNIEQLNSKEFARVIARLHNNISPFQNLTELIEATFYPEESLQ
jgi:hypothetical protein